ncbi:MAG: phage minor capsid protein [Bacillota bacterium]
MIEPHEIQAMSEDLIRVYTAIEDDLLVNVAKRFSVLDEVTPGTIADWQVQKLQQLGALRRENLRMLRRYSGKTMWKIEQIITDAGYQSLEFDEQVYEAAYSKGLLVGMPVPVRASPVLQQIIKSAVDNTRSYFNLINTTALQSAQDGFLSIVNQVYLETSAGITDYNTAMRKAVRNLADQGITGADYISAAGRHTRNQIDVAVRRAIVTSTSQTAGQMQIQRAREWDSNLVEVSSHMGARPSHAVWQGRIYSIEGSTAEYPNLAAVTGYGTVTGLCGANCRHVFYPFFEGLSTQRNKPYDLEENEQVYKRSQQQRALERGVREQKRRVLTADEIGDATGKTVAQLKLKAKEAELKQFIRDAGRTQRTARQQVMGFGHSQASQAVWAQRKEVEKYAAIGYNKDGTIRVTDDWTHKKHPTIPATYKPNAVIDTVSRGGKQRDRMIYDADGRQKTQVNGGNHGYPKRHPYGKNGEHAHDITWHSGEPDRTVRELTEKERKENGDII